MKRSRIANAISNKQAKYVMTMRNYIDAIARLTEADIIQFPTAQRAAAVERDRHRFRLLVFISAPPTPEKKLNVKLIDHLDDLSAEQVAQQMHNYPAVHRVDSMWASEPQNGHTFYFRVLVGGSMPSEQDINAIEERLIA